jgi:hypothetical protein
MRRVSVPSGEIVERCRAYICTVGGSGMSYATSEWCIRRDMFYYAWSSRGSRGSEDGERLGRQSTANAIQRSLQHGYSGH